jgi:hypothetical protein
MHRVAVAVAFAVSLAACHHVRTDPTRFDAVYVGSDESPHLRPPPCVVNGLQWTVAAAPNSAAPVGKRFAELAPEPSFPIYMNGDLGGVVKAAVAHAGMPAGSSGPSIHVGVSQLSLEERWSYNAVYKGNTAWDVAVLHPTSGKKCWSGKVEGEGANYGGAGSAENTNETLSRTMDKALANLFAQTAFTDALCHCQ